MISLDFPDHDFKKIVHKAMVEAEYGTHNGVLVVVQDGTLIVVHLVVCPLDREFGLSSAAGCKYVEEFLRSTV